MTTQERIITLPCWSGEVTIEPLTGGLSNENFVVSDANGRHVVRFGRDYPFHHVDRAREIATAMAAHAAGFGPKIEYAANGVMVSEFLEARTWAETDICENPEGLAELLRRFHNEMPNHITGAGFMFWVFHVIRDYARTLRAAGSEWADQLPHYLVLADEMEKAQVPLPIIFGHNDLLAANILEDDNHLWLIDFEYAGFSTAMFDLAGAASNGGMNADQSRLLLTAYFGQAPTPELQQSFDAMQCASLLREAMWAMVSDLHLDTPGVDFRAYATDNLTRLETAMSQYSSCYGKSPS
jgi:thiamine kinase-like enzyme